MASLMSNVLVPAGSGITDAHKTSADIKAFPDENNCAMGNFAKLMNSTKQRRKSSIVRALKCDSIGDDLSSICAFLSTDESKE